MTGLLRTNGKAASDFDHVMQSLEVIFTTPQGSRPMREWFGNPGLQLLGEGQTEGTILQFFNILYMLTELFEPRFKIRSFAVNDATQIGHSDFTIDGSHKPYAHLDWRQAAMFVSVADGKVTIRDGR